MMDRQELLVALTESLSMEEVSVISMLETFLKKVAESELDEATKAIVDMRIRGLLSDTLRHSRILSDLLQEVAKSDRAEY